MMRIVWDKWQREVLDYQGNIALRCGRQSGKSEVVSQKAVDFAVNNDDTVTLIIVKIIHHHRPLQLNFYNQTLQLLAVLIFLALP